ncbi:N-acetyltransferase [Alicyclobacillus acidoterrestris]|uniref:GNAT family N-acetyltransferase n=1 Tax=Alicyclobacillus suci TaxID=2816080 RepID=UPI0011970202|nr:GNAT family N-acetyltransferase [Alicyclobacillus suci]GEO26778.1 N-acetyltransferase [Alicyclobacillus acidoterrestris]
MIFESEDLYINPIDHDDIYAVVELYNSNTNFLKNHMDTDAVTPQWVIDELESMKSLGFSSYKAIEKGSKKVIGIIDFKIDVETYLSLLMVHRNYTNRGLGKQIYMAFEEYVILKKSKRIRLDVVNGYSDKVLSFWSGRGFHKSEDISLNWNGVILPAVTMIKIIEFGKDSSIAGSL